MRSRTPHRRSPARLTVTPLESRDTPASDFVAIGAAAGGTPMVEVLRPNGETLAQFQALNPDFRGGVRATTAELDGNPNTVEVITAAGPGGGPRVEVWSVDVNTGAVTQDASFFAFEPSFTGGVRVAAGDFDGSGTDDIVVAADAGGGPRVQVLKWNGSSAAPISGPLGDFFAFEPTFNGGVRVAAGDLDGNPADGDELVVAAGDGGGPRVRVLGSNGAVQQDYYALPIESIGGVNVAIDTTSGAAQIRADNQSADVSQRNDLLNQVAANAALQSAASLGSTAVFNTLFANPAFTTALAANGIPLSTVFANGVFNPTAVPIGTGSGFATAFNSVFGTMPTDNSIFNTAFNGLSGLNGTGTGIVSGTTGTTGLGLGTTGLGLGTTGLGLGTTGLGTGTTGLGIGTNGLGIGTTGLGVGMNGLGVGTIGLGTAVNAPATNGSLGGIPGITPVVTAGNLGTVMPTTAGLSLGNTVVTNNGLVGTTGLPVI